MKLPLIVSMILLVSYFGTASAESSLPIIIKQVEMSSYVKSESSTACKGFEVIAGGPSTQWIELSNTMNKTINIKGFTLKVENELNRTLLQDGPALSYPLEIKSGQRCTYAFHCAIMLSSDQRCIQDTKNVVFTFEYNVGGKPYADGDDLYSDGGVIYKTSTPPLTDTYNDTRTWQMINGEWKFAENPQIVTNFVNILSPLKQFMSGITASEVKCDQDFQLILKASNDFPACVKPNTVEILIDRGWAKPV